MLDQLFETYLREKRLLEGKSELTIKSYRQAYNRYRKVCGNEPPNDESLRQYVMSMREYLKETSCNISIRAFNTFLTWLSEFDHTPTRLRIKQIKEPKTTYQGYTDDEIKKVLSFKPQGFGQLRLYTLAALLIDTGVRIEEALTLTQDKVDLNNLLLTVRGKGNKERIVPVSLELRKVLLRYLRVNKERHLFSTKTGNRLSYRNILRDWEALCHKVDIPYRPFHSLRHNFALSFIREGGDVFTLKRLLGHSTLETTQIYVNLQTEDLKRSHAKTSILGRLK